MKKILLGLLYFSLLLVVTGCQKKVNNEEISLEKLVNDDGLVFSISNININCIPVELFVYDDGRYELKDRYKTVNSTSNIDGKLIYGKPQITGKFDYDVIKIIQNSLDYNQKLVYGILTGKGAYYTTDNTNSYLLEYLNFIKVDLDVCAVEDYT